MLVRRAEPGSNQQRADLFAIQANRMRLIVQPWPTHMRGRRVIEQIFFDCVPVEPGDSAQSAGDGGPGPAAGFQVAGEALDVGATSGEQAQLVLLAPSGVVAQVQLVGLPGQAALPGQEPG